MQIHPVPDGQNVGEARSGVLVLYRLDNSRISGVLEERTRIPSDIGLLQKAPWPRLKGRTDGRLKNLHGSHLSQTGIRQTRSDEDNNVAPEQVCCTTIGADEQDVSIPHIQSCPRFTILGFASHANRISHVQISVLPNPSMEKKRKFLCSSLLSIDWFCEE